MQEIILFILTFVIVFVIYEIFVVVPAKKNYKKKNNKQPVEIKYLVNKYKLNLEKIKYNKLLHVCALVSSFDMTIIVTIAMLFDDYFVQFLIILLLVLPISLFSYHMVYLIYKKKGLI